MQEQGSTFAVLGCGVDICYPSSNRLLYEKIQERGGILSAFPPGTPPSRTLFPSRNKIVAGLSDAVLVVEARQQSGTWITVDMALEQGKDVYAVPGRLTDRLSDGCNQLIRQGAGVALSPEDVVAELFLLHNRKREKEKDNRQENREERKESRQFSTLRFLDVTPKAPDEILEEMQREGSSIALPQLLFELIQLCMEGRAKQIGGNYFMKVPE